jgi:hypothetical protein
VPEAAEPEDAPADAKDVTVTLEPPVVLDQATGAVVARLIQSQTREGGGHASLRDQVAAALGNEGPGVTVPPGAPVVVNVTDTALFKASMPLYPQGTAMALLRWRQKHASPASKL